MNFISYQTDFRRGGRCVVIGEVGVNHNGREDLLFKLIDAGIDAGVDIIKLQRFKAGDEISEQAAAAEYQQKASQGQSQLAMAKALELSDELLRKACDYCRGKVGFLCTAFDHGSVDFVADSLGCSAVKIPSSEITNRPLIEHMAKKFDSLLLSTGASSLEECARALEWIKREGEREVVLMHCLSEYPAPISQLNLRAMETMRLAFRLPVGLSDHSEGITAATAAAALGAVVIEKHFTLDKTLPGPDHAASADLAELSALVAAVHDVHTCLGDGVKRPAEAEKKNRPLIRKSVTCAAERIAPGTRLTKDMLGIKRPQVQGAVAPYDIEKVVGLVVAKEKKFDQAILWSDFS